MQKKTFLLFLIILLYSIFPIEILADFEIENILNLENKLILRYSLKSVSEKTTDMIYNINFTLNNKPKDNIIKIFDVVNTDLIIYYQNSLIEELKESKEYDFINSTHALKDGKVVIYRPINIVGSLAFYDSSGKKHYHLYTPILVDAKGLIFYAKYLYFNNAIYVIADNVFLEKASYPIVIDPTFGKTNIGASEYTNWAWNSKYACRYQALENGIINKISWCGSTNEYGTYTIYLGVYSDNSGTPDTLLGCGTTQIYSPVVLLWYNVTGLNIEVEANIYYWLFINFGSTSVTYRYDSGISNQQIDQNDGADVQPPNTNFGSGTYKSRAMSIYATYEKTLKTYTTFYFNIGGKFLYNGTVALNGTVLEIDNTVTFRLVCAPNSNLTYGFNYFNLNGSMIYINNYNYTFSGNSTIWCYFGELDTPNDFMVFLPYAVIIAIVISILIHLILNGKG